MSVNTQELKERYINSIQELAILKEELFNNSKTAILLLIKLLVKKIINIEIKEKEDIIVNLLKRALEKLKGFKEAKIYISTQDYKYLIEKINEVKTPDQNIEFIEDKSMSQGDCKIILQKGEINARVSTIEEIVLKELE